METDPDKLDDLRSAEDTSRLLEEHREAMQGFGRCVCYGGRSQSRILATISRTRR